ncbi:MAG: FKBP-type peptidyl-prolyl cis-trans isomerase [Muribaculaceae bacterium]|nr:FKBP-type peptidyl-prolyl cis-trans isomerase [Muribaculaceae bacterium]
MKRFPITLLTLIILSSLVSCLKSEDPYKEYKDWLIANENWFNQQKLLKDENGNAYYSVVSPDYDKSASVLMHWFNDRSKTQENLSPKYSSTVDVKYIGRIYTGEAFDSSFLSTSPADSIYRTKLTTVIDGWSIAIQQMHVGDSCRVIIPYNIAYGTNKKGEIILPFSMLQFDIKLTGIPAYESKFTN